MGKRRGAWVAVVGAALIAGCGGGDDGGSTASTSAVTVSGDEYSFDAPATIDGGLTTIDYKNVGKEPHEFALAQLSGGKTVEDLKQQLDQSSNSPPPSWVKDDGGVSTLSPGAEIGVTRKLEPGNYAFVCFLPGPGGKPHYDLGMISGITVNGDTGAEPPATDGSITATDKSFDVSHLAAGQQTIELSNDAKTRVSFNLFALGQGKSFDDLRKWFQNGLQGPAPATLLGVTQFLTPGDTQYLDVDLHAGTTYLMIDPDHGQQATFTPK
jgi:uncharacterized cupredoxin-like copper-binding protein